jgi:hypothetical protein
MVVLKLDRSLIARVFRRAQDQADPEDIRPGTGSPRQVMPAAPEVHIRYPLGQLAMGIETKYTRPRLAEGGLLHGPVQGRHRQLDRVR